MPGKRYFLDTVVHKRASLLIFQLEFTKNVIYILSYPESIIGPTMVGLGETIFKIKVLRWLENAVLILVFANTLNPSFTYTFFQLLYSIHVTFNSSKIIWF